LSTHLPSWPETSTHHLPSGLELAVVPLPHLHVASVVLFVRVGSRYERAETNGLSHLLEHVLFRGCEGYPDTYALNTAIERVASGIDAATSRDFTTFEAACLPASVPEVLGLLGAMVTSPLIRDEDVAIEQRIIHEELQDELDAKGRDIDVDNLGKEALFGHSSMGMKVGGQLTRVRAFTAEQCREWHRDMYTAANMVLVVTGPVLTDVVVAAAERAFEGLPRGIAHAPRPAEVQAGLPAFGHTHHEGPQADLQLQWCLPPESDSDWPALFVAQRVLDDGTCARLRHRVVDQLGLAYHASADLESYEGLSILSCHTQTRAAQLAPTLDAMLALIDELAEGGPTDDELSRIHARLRMELAAVHDAPASVAYWVGLARLFPGLDTLPGRLARAFAVGPAEVAAAVARHLGRERLLVTVVGAVEPVARAALRRRVIAGRSALSTGA
jgi:predicted Zn-dependent peptidase